MQIVVNMSDMKLSTRASDVLATFSLGSCIAVALFDPEIPVGGLIHCMLPASGIDLIRSANNPFMFVDAGLAAMVEALEQHGARRERIVAHAAGAGHLLGGHSTYRIGDRNREALDMAFRRMGLTLRAEDTGGTVARSMELHLETGKVFVTAGGIRRELS